MIFFLIIILIAGAFYILGAKNGLPKFGFEMSKRGLDERIEFLSSLEEGDRITTYKFDDDESIHYDLTRTYIVTKNDSVNQQISLKEWNTIDLRPYNSKWFKGVIKKNDSLLQAVIKRNRQKNERKEENND